jgi:hypothetical protein
VIYQNELFEETDQPSLERLWATKMIVFYEDLRDALDRI